MSTKTIEKKLNSLTREMAMLRSVLMAAIAEKDPEGEYRPEFVKRMLALTKRKQVSRRLRGSADFPRKIS
jgi:hypothetical protein